MNTLKHMGDIQKLEECLQTVKENTEYIKQKYLCSGRQGSALHTNFVV